MLLTTRFVIIYLLKVAQPSKQVIIYLTSSVVAMFTSKPRKHRCEWGKHVVHGPGNDEVVVDTADEGDQDHTNSHTCNIYRNVIYRNIFWKKIEVHNTKYDIVFLAMEIMIGEQN